MNYSFRLRNTRPMTSALSHLPRSGITRAALVVLEYQPRYLVVDQAETRQVMQPDARRTILEIMLVFGVVNFVDGGGQKARNRAPCGSASQSRNGRSQAVLAQAGAAYDAILRNTQSQPATPQLLPLRSSVERLRPPIQTQQKHTSHRSF